MAMKWKRKLMKHDETAASKIFENLRKSASCSLEANGFSLDLVNIREPLITIGCFYAKLFQRGSEGGSQRGHSLLPIEAPTCLHLRRGCCSNQADATSKDSGERHSAITQG